MSKKVVNVTENTDDQGNVISVTYEYADGTVETVYLDGSTDLIGTTEDDKLHGDSNDNYIYADAGDDKITAGDGNDTVDDGAGQDTALLGKGDDTVDWDFTVNYDPDTTSEDTPLLDTTVDYFNGNDGNDTLNLSFLEDEVIAAGFNPSTFEDDLNGFIATQLAAGNVINFQDFAQEGKLAQGQIGIYAKNFETVNVHYDPAPKPSAVDVIIKEGSAVFLKDFAEVTDTNLKSVKIEGDYTASKLEPDGTKTELEREPDGSYLIAAEDFDSVILEDSTSVENKESTTKITGIDESGQTRNVEIKNTKDFNPNLASSETAAIDENVGTATYTNVFITNIDNVDKQGNSIGDVDAGGEAVTYAFIDSTGAATQSDQGFTIDATTGEVTFTGALDHETKDSYELTVRAGDPAYSYQKKNGDIVYADPDYDYTTLTVDVNNVNEAPTGAVTIDGTAEEGGLLTANTSNLGDLDGLTNPTFSYEWKDQDGNVLGTASTLQLSDSQDVVGDTISLSVSYTDDGGFDETIDATSSPVAVAPVGPVANVEDEATGTLNVDVAKEGATVTASLDNATDEDGLASIAYEWFLDGTSVGTGASYTISGDQSVVGSTLKVVATTTDNYDGTTTFEDVQTIANVNDDPEGLTIGFTTNGDANGDGNADSGDTIAADLSSLADEDGLPTNSSGGFTFQWYNNGVEIIGEDGQTYTLTTDDAGDTLSVEVSYTDSQGTQETATASILADDGGKATDDTIDDNPLPVADGEAEQQPAEEEGGETKTATETETEPTPTTETKTEETLSDPLVEDEAILIA